MTIDVFAVIADQTRRRILVAVKDSPRPVNDIVTELGVSQPTVSKHLKVLREAGLVSMRAAGQRRLYSIDSEPLDEVVSWAASLGCAPEPAAVGAVPADPESATVPEAVAGVPERRDVSGPVDDAVPEHPQREVAFPSTAAEAPAPLATPVPSEASANESASVEDDAGPSDPAPSSRHARVVFQPLAPLSSRRGAEVAPPAEEPAEARPSAPAASASGVV
ncbi:metalloregulator ArsR/SmtB family transcription factor, partial [Rothia sp. AR01]